MSTSVSTLRLQLPLMAAAQAQKHVTHNEALLILDSIVQSAVEDMHLTIPPVTPTEGARHLVAATATGAWTGHDGAIAIFEDGGWTFLTPRKGWRVWVADIAAMMVHDGTDWNALKATSADRFGISTTADSTNRLAVSGAATLLTHSGSGHQLKINKATAADTASLLFQSGYSGRLEMGLAGDDKLRIKTSADGTVWKEALNVDPSTGYIGLAGAVPNAPLTVSTDDSGLIAGGAAIVVQGGIGAERIELRAISDSSPNGSLHGFAARGTVAAPAAIQNGDRLFGVRGTGHDGTGFVIPLASAIEFFAIGNWSPTSHGSAIVFRTTPSGSTTAARAERLRILDNGNVRIGGDGVALSKLDVDGPVRVKPYTVTGLPGAEASGAGAIVLVTNEAGGAVLAFSDGSAWRRVTDRAVVS